MAHARQTVDTAQIFASFGHLLYIVIAYKLSVLKENTHGSPTITHFKSLVRPLAILHRSKKEFGVISDSQNRLFAALSMASLMGREGMLAGLFSIQMFNASSVQVKASKIIYNNVSFCGKVKITLIKN